MIAASHPSARTSPAVSRSGLDPLELEHCVRLCAQPLASLADASMLVTGATGWFGTWLLDVLCAADDALHLGLRITAVSRDPQRFLARFPAFIREPRLAWITADVRRWTPPPDFTHIIHGAADSSVPPAPEAQRQLSETIVQGTRRALKGASPKCRGFLLVSSGAVYGRCKPGQSRFSEADTEGAHPALPQSAYGEAKRTAEQIAERASAGGVPVRIARCFAFVGPHMPFDRHFAVGNFIADAVGGRPIRIKSDGRPQRSYLYMTDLVRALITVLVNGEDARPYNVGSNAAVSIEQLARQVDRIAGGKGVVIDGAASDPDDRYVPDTSRLGAELGFLPDVPLESAISRTAAWYRAQRRAPVPS